MLSLLKTSRLFMVKPVLLPFLVICFSSGACKTFQTSSVKADTAISPRDNLRRSPPVDRLHFMVSDTTSSIMQLKCGSASAALISATVELEPLLKAASISLNNLTPTAAELSQIRDLVGSDRYKTLMRTITDQVAPAAADGSLLNTITTETLRPIAERILASLSAQLQSATQSGAVDMAAVSKGIRDYVSLQIDDFTAMKTPGWVDHASFPLGDLEKTANVYLNEKMVAAVPFNNDDAQLVRDTIAHINAVRFNTMQWSVVSREANYVAIHNLWLHALALRMLYGPNAEYNARLVGDVGFWMILHIRDQLLQTKAAADVNFWSFDTNRTSGVSSVRQFSIIFGKDPTEDWIGYRDGQLAAPGSDVGDDNPNIRRQWAITMEPPPAPRVGRLGKWINWIFAKKGAGPLQMESAKYLKLVSLLALVNQMPKFPESTSLTDYLAGIIGQSADAGSSAGATASVKDDEAVDAAAQPVNEDIDGFIYHPGDALPPLPDDNAEQSAIRAIDDSRSAASSDPGVSPSAAQDVPDSSGQDGPSEPSSSSDPKASSDARGR